MTDKPRLFPAIERVLILAVLVAVFLSLGNLRLQRPSTPDGVEQLNGWYYLQDGQRVDVNLPCSPTLDALEAACVKLRKTHRVIVMADLGDLREGFWDKNEMVESPRSRQPPDQS